MTTENQRHILDDLLEEICVEHESGYDREMLLEHWLLEEGKSGIDELFATGSYTTTVKNRKFVLVLTVVEEK